MKFVITYSSGKTQEHTTEHETVDAFINQNFGSAWEGAQEAGTTVEMVEVLPSEQPGHGHSGAELKLIAKLKAAEEAQAAEAAKAEEKRLLAEAEEKRLLAEAEEKRLLAEAAAAAKP